MLTSSPLVNNYNLYKSIAVSDFVYVVGLPKSVSKCPLVGCFGTVLRQRVLGRLLSLLLSNVIS